MTDEQISSFIIFHFIPCWIFFGVCLVLIGYIFLLFSKEYIITVCAEDIKTIVVVIILGPIALIVITFGYICEQKEIRQAKREAKRKTCGWWELKEFGGKY